MIARRASDQDRGERGEREHTTNRRDESKRGRVTSRNAIEAVCPAHTSAEMGARPGECGHRAGSPCACRPC